MDTKHLREYVAVYHDELHKMYDEIKTYCLIKGYIELELQEDWDTIAYDLTPLGEAWLWHTPDGSRAIGEREADSVENVLVTFGKYGVRTMRFGSYEVFEIATGKGEGCFEDPGEARMFAWELGGKDISTAHPQPDSNPADSGGEYTVDSFKRDDTETSLTWRVKNPDGSRYSLHGNRYDAVRDAELLNAATAALRQQLAQLQRELNAAREKMSNHLKDYQANYVPLKQAVIAAHDEIVKASTIAPHDNDNPFGAMSVLHDCLFTARQLLEKGLPDEFED